MPECKNGIEEEISLTEAQFVNKCFNSKRHNQKNMWTHAKNTLVKNESVKLDKTLQLILSLPHLDKKLFQDALKNV